MDGITTLCTITTLVVYTYQFSGKLYEQICAIHDHIDIVANIKAELEALRTVLDVLGRAVDQYPLAFDRLKPLLVDCVEEYQKFSVLLEKCTSHTKDA